MIARPASRTIRRWAGAPSFWLDAGGPRRTFASDPGDVADLAGRTAAGLRSTGCTWGVGDRGACLSFGGSSRGTAAFPTPALAASDDWTFGVRFTPYAFSGNNGPMGLISRGDFGSPGQVLLYVSSSGRQLTVDVPFVAAGAVAGGSSVEMGLPHTAFVTKQGTTWRVYLDGRLDGEATAGATPVDAGAMWIGDYADQGFFVGDLKVDAAYHFARPLDRAEVARYHADPDWPLRSARSTALLAASIPQPSPAYRPYLKRPTAVIGSGVV